MTPNRLVLILRLAAVVSGLCLTALLLGPFQGLEQTLGLSDKEVHAIAFFAVTVGLFVIAPRRRRTDLALAALAFGVIIELVQGLTGRSASLSDLMADSVGILAAVLPGMAERLRHHIRTHPNLDFGSIRMLDQRQRASRSPAKLSGTGNVRPSCSGRAEVRQKQTLAAFQVSDG